MNTLSDCDNLQYILFKKNNLQNFENLYNIDAFATAKNAFQPERNEVDVFYVAYCAIYNLYIS